jgi:hypothetical protein
MATKRKTAVKKAAPRKKAIKKTVDLGKACKLNNLNKIPACDTVRTFNPTEAIYSFVAFLTTRNRELILSSHNDSAPVAELVGKFIEANNLPKTRDSDDWSNWIAPPNTEHITNVPQATCSDRAISTPPLDAKAATGKMMDAILGMDPTQQNAAIAGFLTSVKKQRFNRVTNMRNTIANIDKDLETAMESLATFNSVLRGDFTIVKVQ